MVATIAKHVSTIFACLALTACLDDGESDFNSRLPAVGNNAPTITGSPPTSAAVGESYAFVPEADDPDGDPLTFHVENRPSWASFSSITGRLSGKPPTNAAKRYREVRVSVSDGLTSVALPAFDIVIDDATTENSAPTIAGSPPATVAPGNSYSFTPQSGDTDGDTLSFTIANKPAWLTFDSRTGRISGTPTTAQAGRYTGISITASDGVAKSALGPFSIEVVAGNRAPVIDGTPPSMASVGQAYDFRPSASDADGDTLTWTIANRPSWATFNSSNGRLSGTPGSSDVGSYGSIRISVSDGRTTVTLDAFAITVAASSVDSGSVTLSWVAPEYNEDGSPLTDLKGYRVYYGKSASNLGNRVQIADAAITTASIEDLAPATWYFAVTAYKTDGTESSHSNVASKTIN